MADQQIEGDKTTSSSSHVNIPETGAPVTTTQEPEPEPQETEALMAKSRGQTDVNVRRGFNWGGTLRAVFGVFIITNIFLILPYIVIKRGGDYYNAFVDENINIIGNTWRSVKWDMIEFYALILILTVWGSISILFFGGRTYYGPLTKSGFKPEYTHSGFRFYVLSMIISVPLITWFNVRVYYDEFVSLIAYLYIYSLIVSLLLYLKGLYSASPGEKVITGNVLIDYYQGIELYPRVGSKLDLKTLICCRICLFLLQLIYLVMWKANAEINGFKYYDGNINWSLSTVTLLQTVYLGKWFFWEDGYKSTIDIIVDRLGFYLANACICLLQSLYGLYNLYLVTHSPIDAFGPGLSSFVLILGLLMIGLTFTADKQRQTARVTDGKCIIWRKPAEVIRVTYTDEKGQERHSLILASGFWGLSRHPNYMFELLLFIVWSLPAYGTGLLGLWYAIGSPLFLLLILWSRSSRDDYKCRQKYGAKWTEYCTKVPYKIIPYVF